MIYPITPETYRIRMTADQVFEYLERMPPIEADDGRLMTFRDWVTDYIARQVNEGIRIYLGGRW